MDDSLYFFIHFSRTEKVKLNEIYFLDEEDSGESSNEKPECIYSDNIIYDNKNQKYYYNMIFKTQKVISKTNYYFEFEINDDKYIISFLAKENTSFIYDVILQVGIKIIDIKREIPQNIVDYTKKLCYFKVGLEKIKETEKLDKLYRDTIDLFSEKKGFYFFIFLFLEIYKKKELKELCINLMKHFREMSSNPKEKDSNMDRRKELESYTSAFNEIVTKEAKELTDVKNYNYNPIDFYGIILCYLNFYNYGDEEDMQGIKLSKEEECDESTNFCSVMGELYNDKKRCNILYEILLIYRNHFFNPIPQIFEFFNNFIEHCIILKDFPTFQIGLSYIKEIDIFIDVIEKNKNKIYENYIKSNKTDEKFIIKIDKNLKAKKIEKINKIQIPKYILNIKSIIDFSIKNEIFFINFTKDFWKFILNCFNDAELENIPICYKLREIFILYHDKLVNKTLGKLFGKKETKLIKSIKKDTNDYFQIDEFAFLLDQMIDKVIHNNKEKENIQGLGIIKKYNPYYIEAKYSNKVDPDIFDIIDLDNSDELFIKDFQNMNFEYIFKDNLYEYIAKITSKIKTIPNFDFVIKLINIKNFNIIDKNQKKNEDKNINIIIYLNSLNKKYDDIIDQKIRTLSGSELDGAIKVIVELALMNYIYEKKEKNLDFIKKKIRKLQKEIKTSCFIEIIRKCICDKENINKDENREDFDYKGIIRFIFDEFSNNLENNDDINNIIKLIDCIEGTEEKNKLNEEIQNQREALANEFLNILIEKNIFTKEEFFILPKKLNKNSHETSCEQKNQLNICEPNIKIKLLYDLKEKGKLKDNTEKYFETIENLLKNIVSDIHGKIRKKKLEEFLENDDYKQIIIDRFSLINLVNQQINPSSEYDSLKDKIKKINSNIKILIRAKNNLILYFRESQKSLLNELIEIIKENENKQIGQYRQGNIGMLIDKCQSLEGDIKKIEDIKDFLLFNIIYEMTNAGDDDKKIFTKAEEKLENIRSLIGKKVGIDIIYSEYKDAFKKIISKCNNEERANEFIKKFKEYYNLNESISDDYKNGLIEDLTILFKSEKFKLDIDSIIFFFDSFQNDNENIDEWKKLFSYEVNGKYESLSINVDDDFKVIKEKLLKLKENNIYDYKDEGIYNKLFTCLYDQKEAIEFLFSKINAQNGTNIDIDILKDRIDPTNTTINEEDIDKTKECIKIIAKMKNIETNFDILKFIKKLEEKEISWFINYSKKYTSIIELDRYYDPSENIYEQVKQKIEKELTLTVSQDEEKFLYYSKELKNLKNLTYEELINIKNKIPPKNENSDIDKNDNTKSKKLENENEEEKKKKSTNPKRETLIFFKDIITNLEIILEEMNSLRNKGSNLPIKICIKVENMNNLYYYLGGKIVKNFKVIKEFLSAAKNKYKSQLNSLYKENAYLRFLFGKQFRTMMKHLQSTINVDSFLRYILDNTDNNSKINEGFKTVKEDVKDYINYYELYNKYSLESISMYITDLFRKNNKTLGEHYNKMKIRDNNFKGIYLYECKNNSMEEFIINLFYDKLLKLPSAQNVLITNKETSIEEMQAFLNRAILCNYNTLFIMEISDSISEFQQSMMNDYINQLLSYKNEKFNIENKENVEKKYTDKYLDSAIVFVYDIENRNIKSFLNEINKLIVNNFNHDEILNTIDEHKKQYLSEIGNITAITSDICGLGKSGKIRNYTKDKIYFHFPLGGILNKNIIFHKLENLMNKINEVKKENIKNTAIHLDLTETQEKSILNEFFFSFFITKFYSNNENIIFIPKDISIYIEIPNCFEDYLDKFSILKIFKRENITFEKMAKFDKKENIHLINLMLEDNSEDRIDKFIKKNIGINKYSYHQINIFIKLFISQYGKFQKKLIFLENGKEVTKKCIDEFAKCTKYFTNGGFSQLLTGEYKSDDKDFDKKDYIDKLSEIFKNDLNNIKFETPLIFIIKEKKKFEEFIVPTEVNSEEFSRYKTSRDYLQRLKDLLDLPNSVDELISILEGQGEKDNKYVITIDNFKKMILLVYRIKANVPVIIMGDTGCGKTSLIIKLNQLLNNGNSTVKIINVHSGINDEKLGELMEELENEIREGKDKMKKNEEIWLFFDEINTCQSFSLITEIFINRTYNGNKMSDNIRLIGACNPYRKRKVNKEKCGLSFSEDNENELVYLVKPLPQSLLYYVFSFGSLDPEDEKKYIYSIIERLFSKEKEELKLSQNYIKLKEKYDSLRKEKAILIKENDNRTNKKLLTEKLDNLNEQIDIFEKELEKVTTVKLHVLTTEAISQCHIYLRKTFDESIVSLREIARFPKLVEFFLDYFKKKNEYEKRNNNEKNNKLRSIICSIYLCYYIRLTDDSTRQNFEVNLRSILFELVNNKKTEEKSENLLERIENEDFKNEITNNVSEIIEKNFSDFLKIEEDYLIEMIKPDKGIGKNSLLKESTFLLFVSVITNIPLIIIGKPGTGKSLSVQLINKSLKGKYSTIKFFQNYPKIIQTYFQGSKSTKPEDVDILFDKTKKKLEYYTKNNLIPPISMACFDELGLAERSKNNPLKALHPRLDYAGKNKGESFVGISNYSLDAAKLNRALVLSIPDLAKKLDELINTAQYIVESISPKIKKDKIFEILSRTYYEYKEKLRKIKELVVLKKYIYEKMYKLFEEKTLMQKDLMSINSSKIENKIEKEDEKDDKSNKLDNDSNLEEKDKFNIKKSISMNSENSKSRVQLFGFKSEERKNKINEMFNGNFKSDEEKSKFQESKKNFLKGTFQEISQEKEFKYLLKKENNIRIDFHGNRDFYYLIKGIAYALGKSGELGDADKVKIIIKFIERNFGGIEYNIDIDFNLVLDDIKEILNNLKDIIEDYEKVENKKKLKLSSVFLFKKLYNLEWEKEKSNSREDSIGDLKIPEEEINEYNLNNCINDNINDINSRYLLLEIKHSLTPLIIQNIKLENPSKDENIILYDGSPFPEDNNDEYRFKKIIKIHDEAKNDKLIIIENLNQIHPFLFDLYNMNYEIINDEKYARICLDSFKELKTKVNDNFRIIIIVDERFVEKCDLAFLNRLEKINLSFDKLLDKELNLISRDIIYNLDLKRNIERITEINYSLKDLLINCRDQEIKGLIYYYSKVSKMNEDESDDNENKKEKLKNQLKNNVINKIYKILPQDIISILPEDNAIVKKYESKNIYNFNDYINNEENKKFKISIIYTFTDIANHVEGLNRDMSLMVSQIRSEGEFKRKIDEKKNLNQYNLFNKNKENHIYIHFELSNSKYIKFISYYIIKNFKDDNYNYLLIIHINRNFNKKKIERLYSLPDINDDINQIFIDNLNSNEKIELKDVLSNNMDIIKNQMKGKLNLLEEFDLALENYLRAEIEEIRKDFDENDTKEYINEIKIYLKEEPEIKNKIIDVAHKLIEDLEKTDNEQGIVEKIYKEKYINQFTVDIISCVLEYIKEEIFIKNLKNVFKILEDNNMLTTIIEIRKKKYKNIDRSTVKNILEKYLDQIIFKKGYIYRSKFLFNYNIPGFYNFFVSLSNFINEKITVNYFNNEKIIRELINNNPKKLNDFHDIEKLSINIVYKEMQEENKFIFEFVNKIPQDLILNDYITYYLQKYRNNDVIYKKDDIYHKIIELLLSLRFNNGNETTENDNKIDNLIIKIIWIESNINYVINILKIIENSIIIFGDNEDILYDKIEKLYKENNIKYITKQKRNAEDTKEVNQCYYILLAIICYCIVSDEIHMEINYYCHKLKEINKILQTLNDDLYMYLNEMYIIDELIKVIEIFKKNNDIERINTIKKKFIENAEFIQEYTNNEDQSILSEKLIKNFEEIYTLLNTEKIYEKDKDSYDKFRYILFKEIKKINDIHYRTTILNKILEQKEMIKKSLDIFQIVLRKYLDKDEFKNNIENMKNADDEIIQLIERNLKDNIILEETLLYLIEKNSINYYNNILNKKTKQTNLEDEPLKILKDCIKFLDNYPNIQEKTYSKQNVKEFCKLFCLGYIKTFCYIYIKMIEEEHSKLKKYEEIIKVFNFDKPICKMIRLYIYKIIYNKYTIYFFNNDCNITKYKLKFLKDYNDLINIRGVSNKIYKLDYTVKTLQNEDYGKFYKNLLNYYNKDKFSSAINIKHFKISESGIDNFYIASYNLILANLLDKNDEFNNNFFKNVCLSLFKNNDLILRAIKLFYDPNKFNEIQKIYNINSLNLKPILFGYRFCLNELSMNKTKGIYYRLYNSEKIDDILKNNFYPGNDTKLNIAYYNIINHLKNKPDEGCYVCLCPKMYYHSVASGFPDIPQFNLLCPNCRKNIGATKKGKDIIIEKREDYYRIFKDEKDIKELKKNELGKKKLEKINYMTLEKLEEDYIKKLFKEEKGVFVSDINSFKNDKKIVRKLSQVSYRLLNYILYSHLFFARIITGRENFDKYKPEGVKWEELLYECWNLLKDELLKINIDSIESFMHFIFVDLFPKLNNENHIEQYDNLIKLEDKLEEEIQTLIKDFEKKGDDLFDDTDITSYINLLKEKFPHNKYNNEEFPFYKFFYYTDYLDEKYINEKLLHKDENKYPVLKMYLDYQTSNIIDENKDIINNINLFNDTLNLLSQKYFNNISKDDAEKKELISEEIYIDNKEKFDKFIEFYDKLKIDEIKNKENLKENGALSNFFIREDNNFGKNYKIIYQTFIKQQNNKIKSLLEKKGVDCFDQNRANIQQLDEKEIFTLTLPKKVLFNNILFDNSYRKILDKVPVSYNSYKEYVINYNYIEEIMTEYLLSNKKLLNENIREFIYNNELFSNKITDLFYLFTKEYFSIGISDIDKVSIYKFYDSNRNIHVYKKVINDFKKLFKFLYDKKKEETKDNDIKEETPIIDLLKKKKGDFTDEFKALFFDNKSFRINKTYTIFEYYLKVIYSDVDEEIKKYQVQLDKELKIKIKDYFEKHTFIKKKEFSSAIRLFITLVLLPEEDKNNKIKPNNNNIVNYLQSKDLWKDKDINSKGFLKNMEDLKFMNIHINQIAYLYDELGKDIEDDFFDDVKSKMKEKVENEQRSKIVEEREKKEGDKPEEREEQEEQEEQEEEEEEEKEKRED